MNQLTVNCASRRHLLFPRIVWHFRALGRHCCLALVAVLFLSGAGPSRALAAAAPIHPAALKCEYLNNPLGIDSPHPRLSWTLEADKRAPRGQRQTAYHVLVASSLKLLAKDRGDLWDSGRVGSELSFQIAYGGKILESEQQCFWKVRVWNQEGRASSWSEPAHWSMGLLRPEDWKGRWIGLDGVETNSTLTGCSWIWFPEQYPESAAQVGTRYFRRVFDLPANQQVKSARWLLTGDDEFTALVNGQQVAKGANFRVATEIDVQSKLRSGKNLLSASVKNAGQAPNPAGFIGLLRIEFESGEHLDLATDENWQSSAEELAGWQRPEYDDSTWLRARKLGPAGMGPWGPISGPEDRRLAARWLRKEFAADKRVRRATAYISGLGLSELHLNGRKVGDHVLSPALSEYPKRVFYVTYDVTSLIRRGANAVGVVLGNGRYFAPRLRVPTETRTFGFPKLLFQLKLEFDDGSEKVVASDETWRLTTEGPIRANNEYDGEDYDARLEMSGWAQPSFNDSAWQPAQLVASGSGVPVQLMVGTDTAQTGPLFRNSNLRAQMIDPIRVVETLKPVAVTKPKPGVYIFDLGQNMVGWCRLRVSGAAGTTVSLRHAETLNPDGTLYLDNIRSAKVTDRYTLSGKGEEVYEPRFTYHGFRYVEVTGYPGEPALSSLEGRVVHDDLEAVGDFSCSSPPLNRIFQNVRWGFRGNYRSIPTDCPQRDERQGWLGDRSSEARGEMYLFATAAFYSKWMRDIADSQKENGSVPDVCPAYWPLYTDNVTWPSSTVIIPRALYDHYADAALLATHYPSAKKWMDYIGSFVTNGIISRDSYGDWCVPPEDLKSIHTEDPLRKTDKALLATAYLYYDALCLAESARLTGAEADSRQFTSLAASLKAAFNARFLNTRAGQYDNGSQTSCVLPLAFNLVPDSERERVFARLVNSICSDGSTHVGTGLIGVQWLMRVLSSLGRPDVAASIATQTQYPSWGYMSEQGATTIWELWNGDTADPAMNSGNHVMLVGDLVTWLFENVAGIRPDPSQPGFKHVIMKPETVFDWAAATHRSVCGLISSRWSVDELQFTWDVTIPPNTTATLFVPADSVDNVREGRHPAGRAAGVRVIGMREGRAVFVIGSGSYHFTVTRGSVGPGPAN